MRRAAMLSVMAALIFVPVAEAQWAYSLSVSAAICCNGGNVGVGTNTPESLLHLAGRAGVSDLTFDSPGTQKFRFGTIPGITNWGALTINSAYSASGWLLDDSNVTGRLCHGRSCSSRPRAVRLRIECRVL